MWREWRSFPGYRDVVPVLMYHSVGGRPSYLTTSRAQFAEQMRALKLGGFHTLTIQQYAAYVHGDLRGLPERPILLTFDDGRQDAYLAANGILHSYGFHATELAVPGWVVHNPGFSVSWAELEQMHRGTTWDVESHFGYGPEKVTVSKTGTTGARFAYLQYLPAVSGRPGHPGHLGHLETFAEFQKAFTGNELYGIQQFRDHLPGFQPLATAIPGSDYRACDAGDQLIHVATCCLPGLTSIWRGVRRGLPQPGQGPPAADPRPVLAKALLPHVHRPKDTWRCCAPAIPSSAASRSPTSAAARANTASRACARPSSRCGGPRPGAARLRRRPARRAGRS